MLYIVATPIGNLEDITFRALRILKEVDFVACEDTRMTKRLLDHYDIKTPTVSFHQHSKLSKIDFIIQELLAGKNVAVVTDAGTPGISDPGNVLVAEALKKGIQASPIPGPSAITSLASVSGIDMTRFVFMGYAPHKKGRLKFMSELIENNCPSIFYESKHRVVKFFEQFKDLVGVEEIQFIVGRELTKVFEETIRGSALEILEHFKQNEEKTKGEFVIISHKVLK